MAWTDHMPSAEQMFAKIKADADAGIDEGECGVGGWIPAYERCKEAVFTAAHQADHRYDGAALNSQGMNRAEYVGKAVLAALHANAA